MDISCFYLFIKLIYIIKIYIIYITVDIWILSHYRIITISQVIKTISCAHTETNIHIYTYTQGKRERGRERESGLH